MNVEVSRRARIQIERIDSWWTANRPAAHAKFAEELGRAFGLIAANPELGAVYRGNVRRVLMPETAYHVYYRVEHTHAQVTVLHVWGATRGRTPRL